MNDYYKILEIKSNANPEEIKRSYIVLARKYHPDRNSSKNAEAKFKEIKEAYQVLSDPNKRKEYDLYGNIHVYSHRQSESKVTNEQPEHGKEQIKKQKINIRKLEIIVISIVIIMYLIRFSHQS